LRTLLASHGRLSKGHAVSTRKEGSGEDQADGWLLTLGSRDGCSEPG
jgi:hypothetical protein